MHEGKTGIVLYCPEAFSLFAGGEDGPRSGGAGIAMYHIANALAKHDKFEVAFLFDSEKSQKLSHPSIQFLSFPRLVQHGVPILSRFVNKARLHKAIPYSSPVFITMMDENVLPIANLAKSIPRSKTIYHVASDYDVHQPRCVPPEMSAFVLDLIAESDAVISQSQHQREMLLASRGKDSFLIRNGWPLEGEPVPSDSREYTLWVAAIKEHKQPWYFLDLAQVNPDEQFLMIGPPAQESSRSSQLYAYISRRAEQLPNLIFINRMVAFEETSQYFRKAKCFVNTSEFEGFPNTFVQAMDAGTPLVSLGVDPDGFIEKAGCGVSAQGDILKFYSEFQRIIRDDDLLSEMGKHAREYVMENHDIEKTVLSVIEVIDAAQQH